LERDPPSVGRERRKRIDALRSQMGTVPRVDVEQVESAGIRRAVYHAAHEFPAVSGPRDAAPTLPDAALGAAIGRHDVDSGRNTGARIVSCLSWNPATEGDKATIGGPGREHILLVAEGQLSRFPAFYRLNIDMLCVLGGWLPGECNTTAVWRKRRIIFRALKSGQRHDIQDGIGWRSAGTPSPRKDCQSSDSKRPKGPFAARHPKADAERTKPRMRRALAERVHTVELSGEFGHRWIAARRGLLQSTGQDVAQRTGIARVRRRGKQSGKNFRGAGTRER